MARFYGELRPDATYGERELLQAFARLPNDYTVWPELSIREQHEHSADFVLFHPTLGVCLIEAKDWIEIVEGDPDRVKIRMRNGSERFERNPLKGAREKALALVKRLQRKPNLIRNDGSNRLVVPWTYAVAFPNLTRLWTSWLDDVLEDKWVIFQDDLDVPQLEDRLRSLDWRFHRPLTESQIDDVIDGIYPHRTRPALNLTPAQTDSVRSAVDPVLVVDTPSGQELGVLDQVQETCAKDGLFEQSAPAHVDEGLSTEEEQIAQRLMVRLVRGVAGSGKTRVLVARAKYLAKSHPDWRILVVTFNEPLANRLKQMFRGDEAQIRAVNFHQICKDGLTECGVWSEPITDRQGRLANLLNGRFAELRSQFDQYFLDAEIGWLKDTGCMEADRYLTVQRLGRSRPLQRDDMERVWRIFQAYQLELQYRRRLDWEDVPLVTLNYLNDGGLAHNQYDAILIDEAQDFAPVWFEVLKKLINPDTGVIFLAADATQRIYRRFTWRSLGLEVVGRSRVLSRSYRNTYEILHTAFELIRRDELLMKQLGDEEEELLQPDLDPSDMRRGPYPELRRFDNVTAERMFLSGWVRQLIDAGHPPNEIAVLHRRRWGVEKYLAALRSAGIKAIDLKEEGDAIPGDAVIVSTIHLAKGLEYRTVYLGQLQELFKPDKFLPPSEFAQFRANEMRLLYVGLSRARDKVCLTHEGDLPSEIAHLAQFLAGVQA